MTEYEKYKSIQELLEARQAAHNYCRHQLQGVVENIQKLRRQLKKQKSKRWNIYSIDNELIHNQVLLNEVVKLGKKIIVLRRKRNH
jgi:transcription termination factor NusB